MSEDIAMRLRGLSLFWGMPSLAEAADEIERLRTENARLRARVEECERRKVSAVAAQKMALALWGAGFREGELEHRPAVGNATLKKAEAHTESCKNAIISALTWEARP